MKSRSSIIFGIHPVHEALRSGKTLDKILLRQGLNAEAIPGLFQLMREQQVPFQYVPIEKLNRLTGGNHQGIIALASLIEYTDLERLVPLLFEQGKIPALALLDGITDVRNLGAIARSAACAGINAIIIPAKGSAQINADAIKTSAGALNTLTVCRVASLTETVQYLRECGLQIVAASEKGGDYLFNANLKGPLVVILGAEDKGIDPKLLKMADSIIQIPMQGKISSLNVSAAAAVIFFEIMRQGNFVNEDK
jgi:23S rRNA (guanosine2251-2'-O)-methyltransferase